MAIASPDGETASAPVEHVGVHLFAVVVAGEQQAAAVGRERRLIVVARLDRDRQVGERMREYSAPPERRR
jgi:hypothetical protein